MTHKHIINRLCAHMALASLAGLVACSDKPPSCADQETRATAREVIVDEARRQLAEDGDLDGVVNKLLASANVELSGITSEGYMADARKQMCRAHVKVSPAGGDGLEGDVAYTTQRTEDDKSKFILFIENVDQFVPALVTPARSLLNTHKRIGSWAGRLDCGQVGATRDGPRGPFNVPVEMKIASSGDGSPLRASMARSMPQGQDLAVGLGTEQLAGVVGDRFELTGTGSNTSMAQRWTTHFTVTFQGDEAVGQGSIREGDEDVRACQLKLAKRSNPSRVNAARSSSDTPPKSSMVGKYSGEGDGIVTAEIGPPAANGSYPVSLTTEASAAGGGGCAGNATGEGRMAGDTLRVSATDANLNEKCTVTLTSNSMGGLRSEESITCSGFHGAACSFNADLIRK